MASPALAGECLQRKSHVALEHMNSTHTYISHLLLHSIDDVFSLQPKICRGVVWLYPPALKEKPDLTCFHCLQHRYVRVQSALSRAMPGTGKATQNSSCPDAAHLTLLVA